MGEKVNFDVPGTGMVVVVVVVVVVDVVVSVIVTLPGPVGAEFPQPMAGKKSALSKRGRRNLRMLERQIQAHHRSGVAFNPSFLKVANACSERSSCPSGYLQPGQHHLPSAFGQGDGRFRAVIRSHSRPECP
jgi:hypothetical protein